MMNVIHVLVHVFMFILLLTLLSDVKQLCDPTLWVSDDESHWCTLCLDEFSVLTRRHHCRYCSSLLCDNCTTKRVLDVRVCDGCFNGLRRKYGIRVMPPTPDCLAPTYQEGRPDNVPASIFLPTAPVAADVADLPHIIDDVILSISVGQLDMQLFGDESEYNKMLQARRSYKGTCDKIGLNVQ